jgi:hypothetical protein
MKLGAADMDDGGSMMLELSFVVGVTEEKMLDGGGTNGCAEGGQEEGVMDRDPSGC